MQSQQQKLWNRKKRNLVEIIVLFANLFVYNCAWINHSIEVAREQREKNHYGVPRLLTNVSREECKDDGSVLSLKSTLEMEKVPCVVAEVNEQDDEHVKYMPK